MQRLHTIAGVTLGLGALWHIQIHIAIVIGANASWCFEIDALTLLVAI